MSIEHIYSEEVFVHGKSNLLYSRVCSCPYLALFASILEAIGFEGLCCIDYKIMDARPQIFEINPRFGGSLKPYFLTFINQLKVVKGSVDIK